MEAVNGDLSRVTVDAFSANRVWKVLRYRGKEGQSRSQMSSCEGGGIRH
jgi:hypothetical protein